MKIINSVANNKVRFSALSKKHNDETGLTDYKFYLPASRNDVQVEVVPLTKNKQTNAYEIAGETTKYNLNEKDSQGYNSYTMSFPNFELNNAKYFGYRYITSDGQKFIDSGLCTNSLSKDKNADRYTVVSTSRPTIGRNGNTQLIMPDIYGIGIKESNEPLIDSNAESKALDLPRTHINRYGGNFAGIAARAENLADAESVRTIVGMPFTKDGISSHGYWTKNAFLAESNLGTTSDFKNMQKELFKNGINFCIDAALVNEGLTGTRFQHVLKWGEKSPYYSCFDITGNKIGLAVLPSDEKNFKHVGIRVVNDPNILDGKNAYQQHKPTFVQFYDDRFTSKEILEDSNKLIEDYDKLAPDSQKLNNFYESMPPYYFEVDPKLLTRVRKKCNYYSGTIASNQKLFNELCQNVLVGATIDKKNAPKGPVLWDGNVDIPKLSFFVNDSEQPDYINGVLHEHFRKEEPGVAMVRDAAIKSICHWTLQTRLAQMEYVANLFGKNATDKFTDINSVKSSLHNLVADKKLPACLYDQDAKGKESLKISDTNLDKIVDNEYRSEVSQNIINNKENVNDVLCDTLRNYPLQAFECSQDLSAVLSSPYINNVKTSLYDFTNNQTYNNESIENTINEFVDTNKKTDIIYRDSITPILQGVISAIESSPNTEKIIDNSELTEFGKYVLPIIIPEVMNYVLTYSFVDDKSNFSPVKKSSSEGISYIDIDASDITLKEKDKNISFLSPKEEADFAVNRLYKGAKALLKDTKNYDFLKSTLRERLSNLDTKSFALADAIIDSTASGLGMRIDASKDVENYDFVRKGILSADTAWSKVMDFWSGLQKEMAKINPHSLTYAEITDLEKFPKYPNYDNSDNAESGFYDEITSSADYKHFFSRLAGYVAGDTAECNRSGNEYANYGNVLEIFKTLTEGWSGTNPGKLWTQPADGIALSYIFAGNHDKPRLLHNASLDMELFSSDFSKPEHRKIVEYLLENKINENEIDYSKISPKAIAVCKRFNDAFYGVMNDSRFSKYNNYNYRNSFRDALAYFAAGQMNENGIECLRKNSDYDQNSRLIATALQKAETFGVRDFSFTIRQVLNRMELDGEKLTNEDIQILENAIFEKIMEPTLDKFKTLYKTMVCLPGAPTLFAGDNLCSTGYESFAKNCYQGNRSFIKWQKMLASGDNIYKRFYNSSNEIAKLRNDYRLSALNDGETVVLSSGKASQAKAPKQPKDYFSILRYNDKGSVVISTFTNDGINAISQDMSEGRNTIINNGLDRKGIVLDEICITPTPEQMCPRDNKEEGPQKIGLAIGLPDGMVFKKYGKQDDKGVYKVVNENIKLENGKEVLKSSLKYFPDKNKNKTAPIIIEPDDCNVGVFYADTSQDEKIQNRN